MEINHPAIGVPPLMAAPELLWPGRLRTANLVATSAPGGNLSLGEWSMVVDH